MKIELIIIFIHFTTSIFCQDLPTIKEVFDYNIGDEFHYRKFGGFITNPHAERFKIIDRIDNSAQDTITYLRSWDNYYTKFEEYPEPHLVYYIYKYVDTIQITLLDSTINWYLPNENNYYEEDTTLDLSSIVGITNIVCQPMEYEFYWCYSIIPGHGDCFWSSYAKGLGRLTSGETLESTSGMTEGIEMFYYNKGDSVCGIPDTTIVTNSVNYFDNKEIIVYPNPCSDFLIINYLNYSLEGLIRIINLDGIIIYTQSTKFDWDPYQVKNLKPGYYILQILQGRHIYRQSFIKM